jgi:hypothetical protein
MSSIGGFITFMALLSIVLVFKRHSTRLSRQPKYNILELKIRGVIITREYL